MVDLSKVDKAGFAKIFDFVLTRKNATETDVRKGIELMWKYKFACFYTGSTWTPMLVEGLKGLDCEIGVPVDYPFGHSDTKTKIFAVKQAVKLGATAIDMLFNIGALKDRRYDFLLYEMKEHVKAAEGAVTKPILEVAFLTDDEIRFACDILAEAGATYAKSSSGQSEGPTLEQILVMKDALKGTNVKLKAGVKFPKPQNAVSFIKAGCDRIGSFEAPYIVDMFDTMREIGLIPPYSCDE